jgi:hypothetical protein
MFGAGDARRRRRCGALIRAWLKRWLEEGPVPGEVDLVPQVGRIQSRLDAVLLRLERLEGELALLRAEVRGGPTGIDRRPPPSRAE